MSKNSSTFKFAFSDSTVPLLLCKTLSGKEFFALIDTGSEITLIDKSLESEVCSISGETNNIILHSMHGEEEVQQTPVGLPVRSIDTNGELCPLIVGGIISDLTSVSQFMKDTYDIKYDILSVIGSDTLVRRCAIIDCEKSQICL